MHAVVSSHSRSLPTAGSRSASQGGATGRDEGVLPSVLEDIREGRVSSTLVDDPKEGESHTSGKDRVVVSSYYGSSLVSFFPFVFVFIQSIFLELESYMSTSIRYRITIFCVLGATRVERPWRFSYN